ncbi:MAG TPA: tetratricopeptide repeat protein [Pyrinomonadaceae bacterium]|nr:tetratricopeptide repeat protein [Pyrinomonadaceae bacterium]
MLDWLRKLFGLSPRIPRVATDTSPRRTYSILRHEALSCSRADLDLPEPPPDAPIWNMLMETGYPGATVTVAASGSGATSLYISSGYFIIGGGDHENVRQANAKFIKTANEFREHLKPCDSYLIPEDWRTVFYAVTDSGILTANALDDELAEDRHPLSPLFYAGDEVLTQLNSLAQSVEKDEVMAAIATYDQAISTRPDNADLYRLRGQDYALLGEFDKAVRDFDKALSIKPDDADVLIGRGCFYVEMGSLDSALADFDRAVTLDPKNAMAYANRGAAYSKMGNVQQAIADYGSAIQHEPGYANSYANRAFALYKLGDYERGIADCDKALALRPDHANTYSNRGLCRAALGDVEGAAADFRHALKLPCPFQVFEEASKGLRALNRKTPT